MDDSEDQVAISSMTLVEIVYLAERSRIHPDLLEIVLSFLDDPDGSLVEIPQTITLRMSSIARLCTICTQCQHEKHTWDMPTKQCILFCGIALPLC